MRRCHISVVIVMAAFAGLADKHCCKHGENEGLDKRHQYFNEINKYGKPDRHRRYTPANSRTKLAENENQGY